MDRYQNGMILMFDFEKGDVAYRLNGHKEEIQSLSWSIRHPKTNGL